MISTTGVSIRFGKRLRLFGGWYRHDAVFKNNVQIGTIQTTCRKKRVEIITLAPDHAAVLGNDVAWLLETAIKKAADSRS